MTIIELKKVGINSILDLSNNSTEYLLPHLPLEEKNGFIEREIKSIRETLR